MRLAEHVRMPYVHIELLRSENTVPARRQPVQVQGRNVRRLQYSKLRDVSVPRRTDTAIRSSLGGDDEQLGVRLPRGEYPVSLSCKKSPTSDYVDMKKKEQEHDLITCHQPRTSKFAPSQ